MTHYQDLFKFTTLVVTKRLKAEDYHLVLFTDGKILLLYSGEKFVLFLKRYCICQMDSIHEPFEYYMQFCK